MERNEAMEIVRKLYNDSLFIKKDKEAMVTLIPELKESEVKEEKIRKWLIRTLKSLNNTAVQIDGAYEMMLPAIAWLEKQGNNDMGISEATKQKLEDNLNKALEKETPESCNEFLEKQAEQKPTVETKLKIEKGKWYICISQFCNCIEGRAYKATSDSRLVDDFGTEYDMHSDAYKYFRLWTTQDAKDGDVLAIEPIEGYHSPFVAIYKKQNEEDFDSHCFIGFDGKFYKRENGHSTEEIHPATKEQRDLLFQKMKEADYEWDAEKKELRKIEKKPAERSEEDKKMLDIILNDINYAQKNFSDSKLIPYDRKIDWLKSLKDRMGNFDDGYKVGFSAAKHNQWKPSDEQMVALDIATMEVWTIQNKECLLALYQDLKKLREE